MDLGRLVHLREEVSQLREKLLFDQLLFSNDFPHGCDVLVQVVFLLPLLSRRVWFEELFPRGWGLDV